MKTVPAYSPPRSCGAGGDGSSSETRLIRAGVRTSAAPRRRLQASSATPRTTPSSRVRHEETHNTHVDLLLRTTGVALETLIWHTKNAQGVTRG